MVGGMKKRSKRTVVKKARFRKRGEPLDCAGVRLEVGDRVTSMRNYDVEGQIIVGEVVSVGERGDTLVEVRHLDGIRKGQVWSSAAFLWRKESR